jgi:hypothetical protein
MDVSGQIMLWFLQTQGKITQYLLERRLAGSRLGMDMVIQIAISNPAEKLVMQTIQPAMENKMASNFLIKILQEFQCGT